jgi:hypothetical protein
MFHGGQDLRGGWKSLLSCHSERSEESLF